MDDKQFELLDKTVTFAEENERLHEQGRWMTIIDEEGEETHAEWNTQLNTVCSVKTDVDETIAYVEQNVCGSAGCIAGWASIFAGWCQTRSSAYYNENEWIESPSDYVVNPGSGEIEEMQYAAQRELGLNSSQAKYMFSGDNEISDIRAMVEALREDRDAELQYFAPAYR